MDRRTLIMSAVASLLLCACAGEESEPAVAATSDDYVREENIAYQPWEQPEAMSLGEPLSGEVAYGQCEQVEPEPGVDIAIACGQAWAEVAWYTVSAEQVQEQLDAGATTLALDIALGNTETHPRVRMSVHRPAPDGSRKKLAVQAMLFDGDRFEAPIDEPGELYVYVAKGRSPWPLWSNGTVSYELLPSFR